MQIIRQFSSLFDIFFFLICNVINIKKHDLLDNPGFDFVNIRKRIAGVV